MSDELIKKLMDAYVSCVQSEDDSEELYEHESCFLGLAEQLGWKYDHDMEHMDYCEKATHDECMRHAVERLEHHDILTPEQADILTETKTHWEINS